MSNIKTNQVIPRLSDTVLAKGYIGVEIMEKKTKIITDDNSKFYTENKVIISNPSEDSPIQPKVGDYVFLIRGAAPAGQIETNTKKILVYSAHQVLASFTPIGEKVEQ